MKIIDISWPLDTSTTAYKDKKTIAFSAIKTMAVDGVQESLITLGAHSGTHVDAPAHFIARGATIDQVPLDQLMGECKVVDLSHVKNAITAEDLEDCELEEGDMVLLKTSNSLLAPNAPFTKDFVYLDASAARYLIDCGVELVGVDYLGIERDQPGHETHQLLMNAKIAIVEGLRLAKVEQDVYLLVCLPLAVIGLEAAPARAILVSGI